MKKTKLAAITTILLGTIFTCAHIAQRHIEDSIYEKLRDLPFDVARVDYGIFTQRLTLSDFNFDYALQNKTRDSISISIQKVVIEDITTNLDTIKDGIPQVFDALHLYNVLVSLKSENSVMASMHVDTYNIGAYAHNYQKLLTEYKKSPLSEQFFAEVLAFKHEGVEKMGTFFTFYDAHAEQKATLYMKRAFLYPMDTAQSLSLLYEGIAWQAPLMTLKGATIHIDDMRIPNPKQLSVLALALQQEVLHSPSSLWPRVFPKIFLGKPIFSDKQP